MRTKKLISLALAVILLFALVPTTVFMANAEEITVTARPTKSSVIVDGEQKSFDAYNINGSNYFKLRDLAYILNGTEKQFSVGWDEKNNSISLLSGKPYTIVGGEMTGKGTGDKTAKPTSSTLYFDDTEILLTAYHIEGNNYFKLRDIASLIDFEVDWSEIKNTVTVSSKGSYYDRKWTLDNGSILYEYEKLSPHGYYTNWDEYYDDETEEWKSVKLEEPIFKALGSDMFSYYSYSVIDKNGNVEELPYDFMTELSNGYFRAVYDVYNLGYTMGYYGREYNGGNMIYLDRNLKSINNEVYIMAYDFFGKYAIAQKGELIYYDGNTDHYIEEWQWYESVNTYIVYEDGSEREIGNSWFRFRGRDFGVDIHCTDDYNYIIAGSIILDKSGNEIFKNDSLKCYLGNGYFESENGVIDNKGSLIISNANYTYIGKYSNEAFPVALSKWGGGDTSGWNSNIVISYVPSIEYEKLPNPEIPKMVEDFVWINTKGEKLRDMTTNEITRLKAGETLVYAP